MNILTLHKIAIRNPKEVPALSLDATPTVQAVPEKSGSQIQEINAFKEPELLRARYKIIIDNNMEWPRALERLDHQSITSNQAEAPRQNLPSVEHTLRENTVPKKNGQAILQRKAFNIPARCLTCENVTKCTSRSNKACKSRVKIHMKSENEDSALQYFLNEPIVEQTVCIA